MGFIGLLALITIAFMAMVAWFTGNKAQRRENVIACGIICSVISIVLCSITVMFSYINYVGMVQDIKVIQQYKASLELYVKNANAPSGARGGQLVSDVTDQKYEDYQDNLDSHVLQYRYAVTDYNETNEGKKLMNSSWFWRPLIYYPKEHPSIKME